MYIKGAMIIPHKAYGVFPLPSRKIKPALCIMLDKKRSTMKAFNSVKIIRHLGFDE
jgi:hypothetical protein